MSYDVKLRRRESFDGMGFSADWHAEVTRASDGRQLIIIREWRWCMNRALRPKALERAFARLEEREREDEQCFTVTLPRKEPHDA